MEWQLPLQKVEIGNINIGSPWGHNLSPSNAGGERIQKPMAPLSYFGTQFRLPFVSLIFPPLPVVEYNSTTGKLSLDMFETNLASIKLNTLQDTIINAIFYHQASWFRTEFTKEEISRGFQQIIHNNHLHLHCPCFPRGEASTGQMPRAEVAGPCFPRGEASTGQMPRGEASEGLVDAAGVNEDDVRYIPLFKGSEWHKSFSPSDLKTGTRIRVAVKIHGISFLTSATGGWSGRCRLQHRIVGMIVT